MKIQSASRKNEIRRNIMDIKARKRTSMENKRPAKVRSVVKRRVHLKNKVRNEDSKSSIICLDLYMSYNLLVDCSISGYAILRMIGTNAITIWFAGIAKLFSIRKSFNGCHMVIVGQSLT